MGSIMTGEANKKLELLGNFQPPDPRPRNVRNNIGR